MELPLPRMRKTYVYREKSDRCGELTKALAKAQGEFLPVVKDQSGQYGAFASLASMRKATVPALAKYGLSVSCEYSIIDAQPVLVCVLSHESDQWTSSIIPLEKIADAQKRMAYMTYMRRAAYSGILNLASEDDDDGEVAAAASVESAANVWSEQLRLAKDAIAHATTFGRIKEILTKVNAKIDSGDFDPHALGQVEEFADKRYRQLQAEAKAKQAPKAEEVAK